MTPAEPPATVSLSDPGDLIAATPALLGFVPRSSLVALALGGASGRRLGLTLRIDLPPPEHIAGAAEAVVRGMLLDDPAAVVLVVVAPGGDAGPPAFELVERVTDGLASHDVDACHALWTESTTAGSRWRCYAECRCTGIVPRPSASPLAAAARAEGRVVRADRSELERLVAPIDERVLRRRAALLDALIDAEADAALTAFADGAAFADVVAADVAAAADVVAAADVAAAADGAAADVAERTDDTALAEAAEGADVAAASAAARTRTARAAQAGRDARAEIIAGITALDAALDAAQEVLAAGGAGEGRSPAEADDWLDDQRVVGLARALQIPAVRDAAIAACAGCRPAAAEALWAALARGTPDPEAAEPAALLALVGLLRGDGALANVALQRAEAAWPDHRFALMLRDVAAAGVRPSELRACLSGGPAPGVRRRRPSRHRARKGGQKGGKASPSARRRRRGR